MFLNSQSTPVRSISVSKCLNGGFLFFLSLTVLFFSSASAKKIKVSDGTVIYSLDTSTKKASVAGVEDGSSSRKITILDYILNSEDGESYKVTAIEKEAFKSSFLENITLPNTIETIGSRAFETCSLKKLVLPESLKVVGAYAFYKAFYSKTPVELLIPAGCTTIREGAFNGCSIRSIRFNSKLTILGSYSFAYTDVSEVTVPASVTTLGDGVFAFCESLTKATVKCATASIPNGFFDGCTALTTVSIPSSVTSIGIWAFSKCTSLKSIALPAGLKKIDQTAFYEAGLESITFPTGIQTLGEEAFGNIPGLKEVTIPATMTSIGAYCFDGCPNIRKVTVLNPRPCALGTYGFDGQTYVYGTLVTPTGAEDAYRQDKEWSCFHSLYPSYSGIEEITDSDNSASSHNVRKLNGGRIIEVDNGKTITRYDLSGRRLK